jgi:uridine kinase
MIGMEKIFAEILIDKQKEVIAQYEEVIKKKNEQLIKEMKRANELFQLSYKRKLRIQELENELSQLKNERNKL